MAMRTYYHALIIAIVYRFAAPSTTASAHSAGANYYYWPKLDTKRKHRMVSLGRTAILSICVHLYYKSAALLAHLQLLMGMHLRISTHKSKGENLQEFVVRTKTLSNAIWRPPITSHHPCTHRNISPRIQCRKGVESGWRGLCGRTENKSENEMHLYWFSIYIAG